MQMSDVQRLESSQSAASMQQPTSGVCTHAQAVHGSTVQSMPSLQSAATAHAPVGGTCWHVPASTLQVSIVQRLPSSHGSAGDEQGPCACSTRATDSDWLDGAGSVLHERPTTPADANNKTAPPRRSSIKPSLDWVTSVHDVDAFGAVLLDPGASLALEN